MWFKWDENTTSSLKLKVIARDSGQPLPVVIAIWAVLMEAASKAPARGGITDVDPDGVDIFLSLDEGATAHVLEAMTTKGLIGDGRIFSWEKSQAALSNAEKCRTYRARRSAMAATSNDTIGVTGDTNSVTPTPNDTNRHPKDKIREEKKREEKSRPEEEATPLKKSLSKETPSKIGATTPLEEQPPFREPGTPSRPAESVKEETPLYSDFGFEDLREFWSANVREEGERAGLQEYITHVKKNHLNVWDIMEKANNLLALDYQWQSPQFRPGLAKFLSQHQWTMTPRKQPPTAQSGTHKHPTDEDFYKNCERQMLMFARGDNDPIL